LDVLAAVDDMARAETCSPGRGATPAVARALLEEQLLRARGRHSAAIRHYEACLALDRNSTLALAALGQCGFFLGDLDNLIAAQLQAMRLSPADPYLANWSWRIGMVHFLQSQIEAIVWLERASMPIPGCQHRMLGWNLPMH
jgi:tetratricopeptide (TPR) repeat protein